MINQRNWAFPGINTVSLVLSPFCSDCHMGIWLSASKSFTPVLRVYCLVAWGGVEFMAFFQLWLNLGLNSISHLWWPRTPCWTCLSLGFLMSYLGCSCTSSELCEVDDVLLASGNMVDLPLQQWPSGDLPERAGSGPIPPVHSLPSHICLFSWDPQFDEFWHLWTPVKLPPVKVVGIPVTPKITQVTLAPHALMCHDSLMCILENFA